MHIGYIDRMPPTTNTKTETQIIEVWLTQDRMEIICRVVHEDESAETFDVNSLSMRGAQREMTAFFIRNEWEPIGRWEIQVNDESNYTNETLECSRKFRRTVTEQRTSK
jgi:hypothetical protein